MGLSRSLAIREKELSLIATWRELGDSR